jgi:hypothetical protein
MTRIERMKVQVVNNDWTVAATGSGIYDEGCWDYPD